MVFVEGLKKTWLKATVAATAASSSFFYDGELQLRLQQHYRTHLTSLTRALARSLAHLDQRVVFSEARTACCYGADLS